MGYCPEYQRECELCQEGKCIAVFNEQCPEWQEENDYLDLE